MMYSQRQPSKVRQMNLTVLRVAIDGTVATPIAGGMDAKFISTVTDNGTGDYTITFKDYARRALVVDSVMCGTNGLYGRVTAVTTNSFRVVFKTFAGVATDATFTAQVAYHDDATLY